MKKVTVVKLPVIGNGHGDLSFFEAEKTIPFQIKRIYYIYNMPDDFKRGIHAHKQLLQAIFCPYGSINIIFDNGNEKESFILDHPSKMIIVEPGVWREFNSLIPGSVLCVAASEYYDEGDYIRNYDDFMKLYNNKYWE